MFPLANGHRLSLTYKGKAIHAEILEAHALGTGDRFSYSKRDSNPIYKVTMRIPEMQLLVSPQMELNDNNAEHPDEKLKELVAICLMRNDTKPDKN